MSASRWIRPTGLLRCARMQNLSTVATVELQRELARDEGEGRRGIPPRVPPGWQISHEPQSRWLVVRRMRDASGRLSDHGAASAHGFPAEGTERHRRHAMVRPAGPPSASRSPLDVAIYVPFSVEDPSLHDNAVDACEWQPLDVLCTKPGRSRTALLLRLAAVNSQLRVRHIQVLTSSAAEAIGPAAGDTSASGAGLGVFGGYGITADYLRTLAYNGPPFSALSPELQATWQDFIAHDVGIDGLMVEYLLQTAYCAENDEYQRWLLHLSQFAGSR